MSRVIEIIVTHNIRFDEFEQVFDDVMPGFINVGLEKVVGEAQQNSPVGVRGTFRGSLQPSLELIAPVTLQGFVFSSVNYAPIIEGVDEEGNDVEYGRRPGTAFPNIGELRLWVEKVLSPPEDKIDDVTLAVGRRIVSRGIKEGDTPYRRFRPIGKAFNANRDFINREIDRGVNEVFDKL
jgi:hypothetical protein